MRQRLAFHCTGVARCIPAEEEWLCPTGTRLEEHRTSAGIARAAVIAVLRGDAARGDDCERDACRAAEDAHQDERLEVAHVAGEALAGDAPAEDAAVVVEVVDTALAGGAMVGIAII